MDYIGTLKKSFNVWKSNKFLWVLGFFLTTTAFGNGGFSSFNDDEIFRSDFTRGMGRHGMMHRAIPDLSAAIPVLICIGIFIFLISILFIYLDLRANVSLLKSAEKLDKGESLNFKKAWALGSTNKLRLLLINVLISIPLVILIFFIAFLIAVISSAGKNESIVVLICGCIALAIIPLILLGFYLSIIKEIAYRVAILENKGAIDAIKESFSIFKKNLKEYFISFLMVSIVNSIIAMILGLATLLIIVGPILLAIPMIISTQSSQGFLFLIPVILIIVLGVILISLLSGPLASFIHVLWTNLYLRIKELKK